MPFDIKVTIGIPARSEVFDPRWIVALLNLQRPFVTQWIIDETLGIHRARTNIVKEAAGEYIFFLDVGVIPPIDIIPKLMSHGKDIVSALYFKNTYPYYPLAFKKTDNGFQPIIDYDDGLIEVDGIGLGCCLIKRKIFETIPEPWFDLPPSSQISEDLYFCIKAKEAGYSIWVDTTIKCGHTGRIIVNEQYFKAIRNLISKSPTT